MPTHTSSGATAPIPDRVAQNPVLRRTFQYLSKHWHQPISVSDLAAASRLSRRGLHKVFTKHIGHGPGHELRRIRIRRAQQLLAQTDWSQESIAEMCGFTSANSFFVAFKRETGSSPGRYREVFTQALPLRMRSVSTVAFRSARRG